MPTAKKKKAPKSQAIKIKKSAVAHAVEPMKLPMPLGVCRSCHALPAGSSEIITLLLVLVFSLSAVLATSNYALHQKSEEIAKMHAANY